MTDVYENCPILENKRFLLRYTTLEDTKDLVRVYSDKNALPFFNSDNCHGENFYYKDEAEMTDAIKFWHSSYASRSFVRWTIIDKNMNEAVGSVELFHRTADDAFNGTGVLRIDVKNECETVDILYSIFNLIVSSAYEYFDCDEIITKVPVYAIDRIVAAEKAGFIKSDEYLIGTFDGYPYKDYWKRKKRQS